MERRDVSEIRREMSRAEALQATCLKDPVLGQQHQQSAVEIHGLDAAQALLNSLQMGGGKGAGGGASGGGGGGGGNAQSSYDLEELVSKIQSAMQSHDISYLRPLVAEAKGMGLTHDPRHERLLHEADQLVVEHRLAMEMEMNLGAAVKMKDLDALNRAISHAQGVVGPEVTPPPSLLIALSTREEIIRHNGVHDRLHEAIERRDMESVRRAVEEALSLGLHSRDVEDGQQILAREDLKSELEKELLDTCSSDQMLSSALDKSAQYGITSNAVERARVRFEQIKVHRTVMEEIRFVVKNIELLRGREEGISERDLISLQELLQTLSSSSSSASASDSNGGAVVMSLEMKNAQREGMQALARATKQHELQTKLLEVDDSSLLVVVKKLIRNAADLGMKNFKGPPALHLLLAPELLTCLCQASSLPPSLSRLWRTLSLEEKRCSATRTWRDTTG
jgi:hypothetical protein